MVSFVVKAPLAKYDVGARVFYTLNHIGEVVLLHLLQLLVVFNSFDFDSMLGLGLWWLEGAGENNDLSVFYFFGHLRVRKVLIDNNAFNELGVFDCTACFCDYLD